MSYDPSNSIFKRFMAYLIFGLFVQSVSILIGTDGMFFWDAMKEYPSFLLSFSSSVVVALLTRYIYFSYLKEREVQNPEFNYYFSIYFMMLLYNFVFLLIFEPKHKHLDRDVGVYAVFALTFSQLFVARYDFKEFRNAVVNQENQLT